MSKQISLAVITGGKSHDVIGFQELFRGLSGINSYIQHIDDFASSPEKVRDSYDVVLFFFMMLDGPTDDGLPGYAGKPKSAIEHLNQTGQGIVVLHHALLAYPQWGVWDEIVGMHNRELSKYQHDVEMRIQVVDIDHPITRGLSDWIMVDESYLMPDAPGDNQILLKTEYPENMATVAWTRQYQTNRIFCLQSGHDDQTWQDENFKTVLRRGVIWSSRIIPD
jgi:type 1 glutamine amidotransferase